MATATLEKQAVLYRMVMPKSICPSGLKAKALLEREGYTVDDRWLRSRDDVIYQLRAVISGPDLAGGPTHPSSHGEGGATESVPNSMSYAAPTQQQQPRYDYDYGTALASSAAQAHSLASHIVQDTMHRKCLR